MKKTLAGPEGGRLQAEVVHATGDRGRDAVEHQSFQPLPFSNLRNDNQISHLDRHNGQYR